MPIVLPPDTRAKDLGTGLGNLLGELIKKHADNSSREAVIEGYKKNGILGALEGAGSNKSGMALAQALMSMEGTQSRDKLTDAEALRTQAETKSQPIKDRQMQADILQKITATMKSQNDIALGGLKKDLLQAQTSEAKSASQRNLASASEASARVKELQNEIDTRSKLNDMIQGLVGGAGQDQQAGGGGGPLPDTSQDATQGQSQPSATVVGDTSTAGQAPKVKLNLSPADKLALSVAGTAKDPAAAVARTLTSIQNIKPLPTQAVNVASGAAAFNSDIGFFLDNVGDVPTGFVGGKAQEVAQRFGLSELAGKLAGLSPGQAQSARIIGEAERNAVRNGAISGGGFMSKIRFDMAKGVLPSFTKDKATNLASAFVFESALLDQLQEQQRNYAGVRPAFNTKPLDDQIAQTKRTLSHISAFDYDPKSGALIDGQKLDRLVPTKGLKNVHSGRVITRDMVKSASRMNQNMSMEDIIRALVNYDETGGKK